MDKYEYKVRAEEIKELISHGEYVQAAEIADTIDWRRVKSVMMLCTISDLYKINRRYEDARNMLGLAYERRPGGRTIVYSLCELSIKMEEYVQAIEYYKEFVQVAPKDPGRYILQYKLYEAQDVSLEERIAVLEELKKRDYRERWAYELAYLYHRIGLETRCVEECDELILWFGDGKYVIKAMELKMLHQPLSAEQQEKYDARFAVAGNAEESSMDTQVYRPVSQTGDGLEIAVSGEVPEDSEEMDIQVKTMDMGQYNTINLQAELAAELREVLAEEKPVSNADEITRSIMAPMLDMDTDSLDVPEIDEVSEDDIESDEEQMESSEVFFGETMELTGLQQDALLQAETAEDKATVEEAVEVVEEEVLARNIPSTEETAKSLEVSDNTAEIVMEQLRKEIAQNSKVEQNKVLHAEPPKELAGVLSQEGDGQISLVMPDSENIEKQITGQMSIDDILTEWERMKKEQQEKREAELRQHVLQQTGAMFTEFDASVRDGLLEQLEREKEAEVTDEPIVTEEAVAEEEIPVVEDVATDEAVADEADDLEQDVALMEEPQDVIEETDEVEELEEIAETVTEELIEEAVEESVMEEIIEEAVEESIEEPAIAEVVEESIEEPVIEEAVEEIFEKPAPEEEYTEVEYAETEAEALMEEVVREQPKVRTLTREEKELFGPYIQSKSAKEMLVKAIDNISLAAYTGNVIITGTEGTDTLTLAKNIIRDVQNSDSNFSGKVAKISGAALNNKDVSDTITKLKNGALIISKASDINQETAASLYKVLQKEDLGIIVVMEDVKKAMDKFLAENEQLHSSFTARMDVAALSNDTLVSFGKQYAKEREYSIDDLGILALHTRIEELQTIDHAVTVVEVKEIVDEAIRHVNRKNIGHFFDVLLAKRYDEEDMIILSEKDFV